MRHKNMVIGVVVLAALAVAAATAISRFMTTSNESRAYDLARPALYVCQPEEAIIGIIEDWRDTTRLGCAFATAWNILPDAFAKVCRPSTKHPVLAVCHRDGEVAFWAATRSDMVQQLVDLLAHELSDGYNAVEEELSDGSRLYHFATAENRFAHLYYNASVIGFSYDRKLLTSPARDSNLAQAIDEGAASAMPTVVYGDTAYCIFNVKQSATNITYRCALQSLPDYLTGKTDSLQTDAIPASACEITQAACVTAPFIGQVVTRVVLADDTAAAVIAAPITDPRTLAKTLRPYMTSYGYYIPTDSLAHILPASWLGNADYWIEVYGATLIASSQAQTLRQYVQSLRRSQRFSPTTPLAPALFTYISTDSNSNKGYDMLIPGLKVPPFLTGAPHIVQIVADGKQRYEIEITVPSHSHSMPAANR